MKIAISDTVPKIVRTIYKALCLLKLNEYSEEVSGLTENDRVLVVHWSCCSLRTGRPEFNSRSPRDFFTLSV